MEVTFKVDLSSSEDDLQKQANSINAFFNSILGDELVVQGKVEETVEVQKPKRKRRSKEEIAADNAKLEEGAEITFEELSTKVAEKIKKLKDVGKSTGGIVKKLKSYGAQKLDELDEDNYGDFMAYLIKL